MRCKREVGLQARRCIPAMLHRLSFVISIKVETNWCPLTLIFSLLQFNRTIDPYHTLIGHFRALNQIPRAQGGGPGILTDGDQRSWVFLNDPKNTVSLTENPQKYLLKSETLKNTLLRHDSFGKS